MTPFVDIKIDTSFANRLVEEGVLSRDALNAALKKSKSKKQFLIDYLLEEGSCRADQLYQYYSYHVTLPFQRLKGMRLAPIILQRVPIKIASHYQFVPLSIDHDVLTLAAHYPISIPLHDEIRLQLGMDFKQVLALRSDVIQLTRDSYGMAAGTVDKIVSKSGVQATLEDLQINPISTAETQASDVSVINLVNEIILEAYTKRATDIHLEPYRGQFRLRYRIDGVLHDANLSSKASGLILPIISRIKIMANLDIVEHRLPQDGRTIVVIKNQKLDLRISCIPTPFGESVVVRVLKTEMTFDLSKLGLSAKNIQILQDLIHRPHGIILLTGPTGSGKTTTLYTCLNEIKTDAKKIICIEDPIEYEITGITQIQVQPKVGLNFSRGLRSILRHDLYSRNDG